MKTGQLIKVFDDPFTKQKYEGTARLVKKIGPEHGTTAERWQVKFIGEQETYPRTVWPDDIITVGAKHYPN